MVRSQSLLLGGRVVPDRSEHSDLAKAATELLAANALDALRGPMSRGAVPTSALAELLDRPRSTVARHIDRETGRCGATGFDLVVRSCFDANRNGTSPRWEGALAAYVESQGPPGMTADVTLAEPLLKKLLSDGLAEAGQGDTRTHVLVGYLLHSAALLHRPEEEGRQPNSAAATILELRSDSYAQLTAVYASALRFVMSASRRRPKGDYTVEDIVVMLGSLFDGYYMRHALDRDRFPLDGLADVIWDLTVTMTEPGFLAEHDGDAHARDDLVERALAIVKNGGKLPDIAELAALANLDVLAVSNEFSEQEDLAAACLERLCRHTFELRTIAGQTVELARWTLRGFLAWIASLVHDYGSLVSAAPEAKVWGELESSIDMMLLSTSDKLEPVKRREIARKLLDSIRKGSQWEPALEMLLDVLEPPDLVRPEQSRDLHGKHRYGDGPGSRPTEDRLGISGSDVRPDGDFVQLD